MKKATSNGGLRQLARRVTTAASLRRYQPDQVQRVVLHADGEQNSQ
jgi:hypothetical protein